MEQLKKKFGGIELYQAGLPNYPRNFTRDSIISAILMGNSKMLLNQLTFCAKKQGKKQDSYTGEEPGKIIHEYPEIKINKNSTKFNACDTTALFLIGHEIYQKLTGNKKLADKQRENIKRAAKYILVHLKDGLFIEDPKFSGAKSFALKVTYWKDSKIFGRKNGKPEYPISYTLAHVQNMRGLKSAAKLLGLNELKKISQKMFEALIKKLYDSKLGTFYIGVDNQGKIKGVSSDSLHLLFYLDKKELSKKVLKKIVSSSKILETPAGYRTLDPKLAKKTNNPYHDETIWPFEQAIIHNGAKKFCLEHVKKVSERIVNFLDTNHEIFWVKKEVKKGGCNPHLWTIATKKYFSESENKILI